MNAKVRVHSVGERDLSFSSYAGKVAVDPSPEALTPFGGFAPWAAFMKQSGFRSRDARVTALAAKLSC